MNPIYYLAFHPPKNSPQICTQKKETIVTHNGIKLYGYFFKSNSEYVVLVNHGNAEDIDWIYNKYKKMSQKLNINIFIYDYIGYGESKIYGYPSEFNCYFSAKVVLNYLMETKKFKSNKIIVLGFSIGSGPSCYLCKTYELKGLILQSPMLSIVRTQFNCFYNCNPLDFCKILFEI